MTDDNEDDPDEITPDNMSLPSSPEDEIEIYKGNREKCDQCGREFTWGELIFVSSDQKRVFCHTDLDNVPAADKHCALIFSAVSPETVCCTSMKFQGE